ncbi:NUDIX domain-containing protein [bacterium]|nr:NUDIX domain-containing protein [bacterium]
MDNPETANSGASACSEVHPRGWHRKARNERPPEYPERFPVPDELVSWETDYPGYRPPYYVSPVVLANDSTLNPKGWADPEDISLLEEMPIESMSGSLTHDEAGRPLNPVGRTGMAGRGLLGKWGPNYAADPLITRISRTSGTIEMLAVQRKDNGQWAIPGGMVDKGEEVTRTLSRELREETGVTLDMDKGRIIYRGYIDDPRNTDHSWMETTAKHLHLAPDIAERMNLEAGDDARAVRWLPLTPQTVRNLYASHCQLISAALSGMADFNPFGVPAEDLAAIAALLRSLREDSPR